MNKAMRPHSTGSGLQSWQWACLAFSAVLLYHLVWIWQGFDMTDEGYNLTNQWLIIDGSSQYSYGMKWLSDLAGGIWLWLVGDLGLIGARIGWAITSAFTGLASFLILKRYFSPLSSFLAVLSVAMAISYHGTMTINYNNFPALLLIGSGGLLLASQQGSKSRRRQEYLAVLGGGLLGLAVMARFPLILALFLPFVPPIMQALLTRRMPSKPALIKAVLSLGSALLTILVFVLFLQLTGHLAEYWSEVNTALFAASPSSSHSPANLLQKYYTTAKSALFWGIKFLFAGLAISAVSLGLFYLFGKATDALAKTRAFGFILLVLGLSAVVVGLSVVTPEFIANNLSPDGVLENATLQRIGILRMGMIIGGGIVSLLAALILLCPHILQRLACGFRKLKIDWQWLPVIVFGLLFFGLLQHLAGSRSTFSLLLPGVCFVVGGFELLLGIISFRSLDSDDVNRLVLLTMGISVALLKMLGSNNGISSTRDAMWLAFPVAFLLLAESTRLLAPLFSSRTSTKKQSTGSSRSARLTKKFVVAALAVLVVIGVHIRIENPYRDLTNRCELTTPLEHSRLQGVFTSSGRATSVNELFDRMGDFAQPGDLVLAYSAIPMVHYVTKTLPALGNPWPTLMQPPELEMELDEFLESQCLPRVVVRTRCDTANRRWGEREIASPQAPLRRVADISILDEWISEQGYDKVWSNRDFTIYII